VITPARRAFAGLALALASCTQSPPTVPPTTTRAPGAPRPMAQAPAGYVEESRGGWTTTALARRSNGATAGADDTMTTGKSLEREAAGGDGAWDAHAAGAKPMAPPAADPAGPAPAPGEAPALRDGAPRKEASGLTEANQAQPATPLRAGDVDDNQRWDEYLAYHHANAALVPEAYRLDLTERYVVEVVDRDGRFLPNARLGFAGNDKLLAEATTTSGGRTMFFPRTSPDAQGVTTFDVTVQHGTATKVVRFERKPHGSDTPWRIELDLAKPAGPVTLELVFCLDTTGSMGDEIARVQSTLLEITKKIRGLAGQPTIRYGMVLYRDLADEYVARRFGFTTDAEAFDVALKSVSANGGGDTPEALNMGLFAAVDQMPWSENALRLVFLVADAPPHLDYADDVPFTKTIASAVARGVKVFPTAASGLDPQGTFCLRQIAQFTLARFLFIEYGKDSAAGHGIGGGPVASNNLDDLVLRIVESELGDYVK